MKGNKFTIKVMNVGKEPQLVMVTGDDGWKRPAQFPTIETAREASRIIEAMRIDSAFLGVQINAEEI